MSEKLFLYFSQDGKIIMLSVGLGRLKKQGLEVVKTLEDLNLTTEKLLEVPGKLYDHCEHKTPNDLKFSLSAFDAIKVLLNAYTRWIFT